MNIWIILFVVLQIIIIIVAVTIIWRIYSRRLATIENLKKQGRVAELIQMLEDPSLSSQRSDVLTALAELRSPQSAPALAKILNSTHGHQAAEILASIGAPAVEPLLQLLREGQSAAMVVQGIAAIGAPAQPIMLETLHDSTPHVRRAAVSVLDALGWKPTFDEIGAAYWLARWQPQKCIEIGAPAVAPLVNALKDPELRVGALRALGAIGDARALPYLLKLLKQEPELKEEILSALGQMGEGGINALTNYLIDPDINTRRTTAETLGALGWQPPADVAGAAYWAALGEWDQCAAIGGVAVIPLARALEDPDVEIRRPAAAALGQINSTAAVEVLLKVVKDPNVAVQIVALRSLGQIGLDICIPPLVFALEEPDLRSTAAEALARIGPNAVSSLITTLHSHDWETRQSAARALEKLHWYPTADKNGAAFYVARGQWNACIELGAIAIDALTEALEQPLLRQDAAQALGKIGHERSIGPLIQALKHESSGPVQRSIARAIAQVGAPALPALIELVNSRTTDLEAAVIGIGQIGNPKGIDPLLGVLKDRGVNWTIRKAAGLALADIGPQSITPLIDLLHTRGLETRFTAIIAEAMTKIGKPAVEPLIQALSSKDIELEPVIQALGEIGDERAIAPLVAMLRAKRFGWELRKCIIEALGKMGGSAIVPMVRLLDDMNMDQKALSAAIVKIGSPAVDPLLSCLKSLSQDGRESAVTILGRIGDPRAAAPLAEFAKEHNVNKKALDETLKILERARGSTSYRHSHEDDSGEMIT